MSLSNNYPALAPNLLLDFANSKVIDSRIGVTRASTATYFDQLGVLQTAQNNVPRIDFNPTTYACNGLLVEEARTNSIRNNTMQGAVAGTPGTVPTNWQQTTGAGGITTSVIGTGIENGITYVDLRWNGTPTSNNFPTAFFDTTTGIAALQNQTWTISSYVKFIGGSLTNVSSLALGMWETDASGIFLASGAGSVIAATAAALSTQRNTFTRTLTNASTAFVRPFLVFTVTNGAAIDITLRIGLPQLELGAFATSVIPTTTTALTRQADAISMTGTNFSSWYNAAAGSLLAQGTKIYSGSSAFPRLIQIGDATNNNAMGILWAESLSRLYAAVTTSGVPQADIGNNGLTQTANHKSAFAYQVNDFAISNDGLAAQTDAAGTIPSVDRMFIGKDAGASYYNGYIRRISYYPLRNTNAQLQALTGT